MLKIEKLIKELRDEIIEEVNFHFVKAVRESNTVGDLLRYKPDEINMPDGINVRGTVTEAINSEIRRRYRNKVQEFIDKKSLDK